MIRRLIEIKTRFVTDYIVYKLIDHEHEIYCVIQMSRFSDDCAHR